jgi:hypothetical protein
MKLLERNLMYEVFTLCSHYIYVSIYVTSLYADNLMNLTPAKLSHTLLQFN